MKLVKRIIIGTDFSEKMEVVLQAAADLAQKFDSEVYLIHAIEPSHQDEAAIAQFKNEAQELINSSQSTLRHIGVKKVQTIIGQGSAARVLADSAEDLQVNAILLGASSSMSTSIGSIANTLLRNCAVPVFSIPHHSTSSQQLFKKILCPVNGSKSSLRALRNAIHLSRSYSAKLFILGVYEENSLPYETDAKTKVNKKSANIDDALDEALQQCDVHGIDYETVLRSGHVAQTIENLCNQMSISLLVMGIGSTESLRTKSLGKHAQYVSQRLIIPTLFLRDSDPIRLEISEEIQSLEQRMNLAQQLMDTGFTKEAVEQFRHITNDKLLFPAAWEGLSLAQLRLGNYDAAKEALDKAKTIRKQLESRRMKAEVQKQHELLRISR